MSMTNLGEITFQLLFLGLPLLPAAVGQGLCIRYDWLPQFRKPMDLGLTVAGKRIFGDHKTWRGLVLNLLGCVAGASGQFVLQAHVALPSWLLLVDYTRDGILVGVLLGLGATVGELPNSFLKRQLGILPGQQGQRGLKWTFVLLDQVDITLGIWLMLYWLVRPTWAMILWSLCLTLVLHLTVSLVGYALKMRKTPY